METDKKVMGILGQAGEVVTVRAQDSFTDVNGTLLTAHQMDIGTGWSAFGGILDIQSNEARTTVASSYSGVITDTGISDGVVEAVVWIGAGGSHQLVLRATDLNNYWLVHFVHTLVQLNEVNAGTSTMRVRHSFIPSLPSNTFYTLRATMAGATIAFEVVGQGGSDYTLATFNQGATKMGIRGFDAGARFDNFKVTS